MKKKIVALLLTLVMFFTLMTVTAAAVANGTEPEKTLAASTEGMAANAEAPENTGSLDNFKKGASYPAGKFTDVPSNAWYIESVKAGYEYGLVKGSSETTFNPSGNMTVAEAVTLAARLHSIYYTGKADFAQGKPWY